MYQLDEFDKKILNQLQQNNRITADELGDLIGLSTSAVQRRITKLRKDKVIEADISIISPTVAENGVLCVVDVTLELGNSKVIDAFKSLMQACPDVMQCYYVTGAYDFVVMVRAKDMKHYEDFIKKYLMDNSTVKQFYTHVVMDKVKVNHQIIL
jgi:Lrp/AsnC family transcriptional regulator, leucine-responsive regulatory protein